ncbi:MAG: hypothetical protein ACLQBD_11440 [Syntrophobacteraceae bacterium]
MPDPFARSSCDEWDPQRSRHWCAYCHRACCVCDEVNFRKGEMLFEPTLADTRPLGELGDELTEIIDLKQSQDAFNRAYAVRNEEAV